MAASPQPAPSSSSSSQQAITTRLHISGLSPTLCSLQDLTNRFTPYASVLSISHWPPTNDALGQPRNWAFVTLKGSRDKIRKCVNTLSGTVWKGSKVRIGEAKKDFKGGFGEGSEQLEGWARLNEDRTKAAPGEGDGSIDGEGEEKKRKKRKRRLANGREEQRISKGQVITEEDVKAGKVWGWRVTPAGHLIRPLQMRPTHPLPTAITPTPSASASKTKRRKKTKEPAAPKFATTSRARNQLIDPARYGAVHLSGETLAEEADGLDTLSGSGELWVCEDVEGEEGKVRWVRSGGGEVEEVRTAGPKATAPESPIDHQREVEQTSEGSSGSSSSSSSSSSSASSSSESSSESNSDADADIEAHPAAVGPVSLTQPSIIEPLFTSQTAGVGEDAEEDTEGFEDDDEDDDDDEVADGTFQIAHYDPEEDDAFSEGYNEDALPATAAVRQSIPLAEKTPQEKERELKLLREMFGSKGLASSGAAKAVEKKVASKKSSALPRPALEDDEDEGEWWKQLKGDEETRSNEDVPYLGRDVAEDQQETSEMQVDELEMAPQASDPSPRPSSPVSKAAPAQTGAKDAPASAPVVLSKRAALLAQMKAASASSSTPAAAKPFQPVQRYEPASVPVPSTGDDSEAPQQTSIPSSASAHPATVPTSSAMSATPASAGVAHGVPSEVKMGSLKDMFKPQAGGGASSFSLFGSGSAGTSTGWGLGEDELDEDFDFGFDDGEEQESAAIVTAGGQTAGAVTGEGVRARVWGQRAPADGAGQAGSTSTSGQGTSGGPPPFFFPRFDDDPRDPVVLLQRPPSHSSSSGTAPPPPPLQPFWRTESPAALEALWASRKVELTQDYKRRHREAVKKKRRRVTGSRRAGEGMGVGVAAGRTLE